LEQLLLACEADYRGRPGCAERAYAPGELLRRCARAVRQLNQRAIAAAAAEPGRIPEDIRRARLAAIRNARVRPAGPAREP
jgi:tRNA nucleotidyltransferase (CCA-adding enzyme)